jgi:hypothetical protein
MGHQYPQTAPTRGVRTFAVPVPAVTQAWGAARVVNYL